MFAASEYSVNQKESTAPSKPRLEGHVGAAWHVFDTEHVLLV